MHAVQAPALVADLHGWEDSSELVSFSLGELHTGSILELLVHVLDLILIYNDLWGLEYWGFNESQVRVTNTAIIIKERLPDEAAE